MSWLTAEPFFRIEWVGVWAGTQCHSLTSQCFTVKHDKHLISIQIQGLWVLEITQTHSKLFSFSHWILHSFDIFCRKMIIIYYIIRILLLLFYYQNSWELIPLVHQLDNCGCSSQRWVININMYLNMLRLLKSIYLIELSHYLKHQSVKDSEGSGWLQSVASVWPPAIVVVLKPFQVWSMYLS